MSTRVTLSDATSPPSSAAPGIAPMTEALAWTGTALCWISGVVFLLGAVGAIGDGELGPAFFMLLLGALLVPPLYDRVRRALHRPVSGAQRATIGVVLVLALAWSMPASTPSSISATAPNDAMQGSAPRRQDAPPPRRGPQVGESFTLGDFVYVITGATRTSTVGNEFIHRQAPAGSSFVLVNFQITNRANETKTVMTDDFVLKDGRGRTFRPSSDAATALAMSTDDHDLLLSELQPGIARPAVTPFLVPDDALGSGLRVVVPEKGLWRTDTIEIALIK